MVNPEAIVFNVDKKHSKSEAKKEEAANIPAVKSFERQDVAIDNAQQDSFETIVYQASGKGTE